MYYQERQEAIEDLYIMLDGHRHQIQISFLNQITDSTSITQIVELANKAYDTPQRGAKFVTTESAERYVRRFGGRLRPCYNHPDSYPTLIDSFGDHIGIVM